MEKKDIRYVSLDHNTEAFIICGELDNGTKAYLAYSFEEHEYIWCSNSFDANIYNSIAELEAGIGVAQDIAYDAIKTIKGQLVTVIDSALLPRIEINREEKENNNE